MNEEVLLKDYVECNIMKCSDEIRACLGTAWEESYDVTKTDIKVSFVIMTLNEERCIKRCIESIADFADEIVIIDTGSTDQTIEIIKNDFPQVKLYHHQWRNDFSEIRNLLIEYASYDWVFQIDADEYFKKDIPFQLKKFIYFFEHILIEPKIISPILVDHDFSQTIYTRRLFKKDKDMKYYGVIHEELRYKNQDIVPYLIVNEMFYHDGYSSDIMKNKNKYERNLKLINKMLELEPKNPRWYYYFAREAIGGKYPSNYIMPVIEKGMECLNEDASDYYIGLITKLMEINIFNNDEVNQYAAKAKSHNPACMDIYYYEHMSLQFCLMDKLFVEVASSIDTMMKLPEVFSLINSNGDHLFYIWGWSFFSCMKFDKAFDMWKKISSPELIRQIKDSLSQIRWDF